MASDNGTYLRVSSWMLLLLILSGGGYVYWKRGKYEKELLDLRNQIGNNEKTIEVQKGVFEKKLLEMNGLQKSLDTSKSEQARLLKEIEKQNAKVVAITEVSIKLRKDYEEKFAAKQSKEQNRVKVEFSRNFGPYNIKGYTLTDPAEAMLKFSQERPLRLTLGISQLPDKSWRAHVATNDDGTSVEIKLATVDPYILGKKWYENLGLMGHLAGGSFIGRGAALLGLGATYDLKQFTFGPSLWFSTTGRGDIFLGATLIWRPLTGK